MNLKLKIVMVIDECVFFFNKKPSSLLGAEQKSLLESGVKTLEWGEYDKIGDAKYVILFSGGQEQVVINSLLSKIGKKGLKIGWWMCDFRLPHYFRSISWEYVDYLFIPFKNNLSEFGKLTKSGAYFMPQNGYVYNSGLYIPNHDAIFIGDPNGTRYHENRPSILTNISKACKLKIINGQGTTLNQTNIYKSTPISISITTPEVISGVSNRLYNILAASGFVLTNYISGYEDLFENGKHLVWFKNIEEIPELVKYYLGKPDEIAKIKKSGNDLYKDKHTNSCRIKNMYDIMSGKTKEFYGYK